jgi:RNA polymerase sigma factor (sigma-70 family)
MISKTAPSSPELERDKPLPESAAQHAGPTADDHLGRVEDCFKRHHEQMVRWLEVRAGSLALAREIADEAFTTLLQLRHPVDDMAPYVYTIARNALARRLKTEIVHRRIQAEVLCESQLTDDSLEPRLSEVQQAEVVQKVLMSLKPRIREAVRLHFWEDLPYSAIVDNFAERGVIVSTRTVMRWMAFALGQCRRALRDVNEREP